MTADLGAPRVTAVLLVTVPTVPGRLAAADLRESMQRNGPIPAGCHVRLMLGRARYAAHDMLPLLANWLRPAASVVVEGQSDLSDTMRRALVSAWASCSDDAG